MSLGRGSFKMAVISVRSSKWRSLLTMTGIIIGISSVVTVASIGEGVKRQIAGQTVTFGKDLISIRPGPSVADSPSEKLSSSTDFFLGQSMAIGLTGQDVRTIAAAPGVKLAAPLGVVPGVITPDGGGGDSRSRPVSGVTVLATNEGLPEAVSKNVAYGAFFSADEADDAVAVIGSHTAQALFHESVPLGRRFVFRGETFMVRGVFNDFSGTPFSPAADFNNAVFIPTVTAAKLTDSGVLSYTILAKPTDPARTGTTIKAIESGLLKAHGGQRDFSVLDQKQSLAVSSAVLDTLTMFIAGVAGIALLVGGVGIMNIMLVSVTERMHEIGVRKAVGATSRQILNQFMLEAAVLSVTGGIIGVIVSLLIDLLLRAYTNLKPEVSWQALAVATGVSVLIGIVFGTAPALKAARKDPIEALRHE